MLFIITGDNEKPLDIMNVLDEEEEVLRIMTSLANTAVDLLEKTGDTYSLHTNLTLAVRLGVWIERNMSEATEEHLGEGMSLQELKDMDEEKAMQEVIKTLMKETGRTN